MAYEKMLHLQNMAPVTRPVTHLAAILASLYLGKAFATGSQTERMISNLKGTLAHAAISENAQATRE